MTFWQKFRKRVEEARDMERASRLATMRVRGDVKMGQQEFKDAGKAFGVKPYNLAAVASVESSGRSYGADGRLKILFEPHIFNRVTKGKYKGLKLPVWYNGQTVEAEVSYGSWRRLTRAQSDDPSFFHIYKLKHEDRWDLLIRLYEMDERALEACSWGGYQILGKNYRSLGYVSCIDMVRDLYGGEAANLGVMIRFVRRNNIMDALKVGDWLKFAKMYNGRGQAATFAKKLANAAKRHKQGFGLND